MNDEIIYAVYGKSGYGRETIPLLAHLEKENTSNKIVFIDDANDDEEVNGYSVWSFDYFVSLKNTNKKIAIAISDGATRKRLSEKCIAEELQFMTIRSQSHSRLDECRVGEGAIFSPYTMLTSNIEIGKHFHCNIYSYVAHDCVIGDFVTFAPGVKCNGNVHIDDCAYVGTGAILRQGTPDKPLRIGAGAIVGMGAVVTKDVPANVVVVGNPARILEK